MSSQSLEDFPFSVLKMGQNLIELNVSSQTVLFTLKAGDFTEGLCFAVQKIYSKFLQMKLPSTSLHASLSTQLI